MTDNTIVLLTFDEAYGGLSLRRGACLLASPVDTKFRLGWIGFYLARNLTDRSYDVKGQS